MNHELIEILTEAEKTFREYAEAGGPQAGRGPDREEVAGDFFCDFCQDESFGIAEVRRDEPRDGRAFSRTRTDWLRLADNCKRLRESLASGGLSLNVGLEVVS